jgi:hypothetical protein
MIEVLCQNDPYRYVKMPDLLEDFEYTKWLDPAGVPCYVCDK